MIVLLLAQAAGLPVSLRAEFEEDRPPVALSFVQSVSVPDGGLDGGAGYDDLFDVGYGARLELDYLLPAGMGWSCGPYFSLGVDVFTGQEEAAGGVRLEADSLTIANVLVGFKGAVRVDPRLSLQARLGVGLSHFFSTDAEVLDTGATVELLDASTEIAGETGFGAVFALGTSVRMDFGAGLRLRGSAEEGEVPLNPDTMLQYLLEVGVGLRF